MEISQLIQNRQFEEAAIHAGAFLDKNPDSFKAWSVLGLCFKELKDFKQANLALSKAISLQPEDARLRVSLAFVLIEENRLEEALIEIDRALLLSKRKNVEALLGLSLVHRKLGDLKVYEETLRDAYKLNPKHLDVIFELIDYALWSRNVSAARELASQHEDLFNNQPRGNFLRAEICRHDGDLENAIQFYLKTLDLEPRNQLAAHNLGTLYLILFRYSEAKRFFHKSIEIDDQAYRSWHNLALLHQFDGRLSLAEECLTKALEIKPDYEFAYEQLMNLLQHMHRWDDPRCTEQVWLRKSGTPPFTCLPLIDDPEIQKQLSIRYNEIRLCHFPELQSQGGVLNTTDRQKIRLGYFTADLRNHATFYLMAGVFRLHDRAKFKITVFSYGPPVHDETWKYLESLGIEIVDCSALDDVAMIHLARSYLLDIAIDLKGYTQDTRSQIFNARLAPVQVSYLGYPGTSGQAEMDYIIADRIVVPPSHEAFYTEEVIRLPHCYQPNDNQRVISTRKYCRVAEGLPSDCFVFCCLNQNYKITQSEVRVWSEILNSADASILWLLESNKWSKSNLIKAFQQNGINPSRIIFSKKIGHQEHLARLRLADLFLDTFNVNAHTTASDALWAGVPVLTKLGDQFAARVCGSLMINVGLPELVATDEQSYIEMAIRCAKTPKLIDEYKRKLDKPQIIESPLYNTEQYVHDFEALLENLWRTSSLREDS